MKRTYQSNMKMWNEIWFARNKATNTDMAAGFGSEHILFVSVSHKWNWRDLINTLSTAKT